MITTVLFDLDGTLLNSLPDISRCMNTVLEKHGLAKIVSMFQNEEEQREIAGLFHATIRGVETEGDKENGGYSKETFEKALKETIVRVKQNSIEYHLKNMAPTDMAALQRSVADKKALEELEKVHISID